MDKPNFEEVAAEFGCDPSAREENMELQYCYGDDGRAYYTKAHVPFEDFMTALRRDVDPDDPILGETPTHCWMRVCRDFQEERAILVEAAPESRGAFRATWIQDA